MTRVYVPVTVEDLRSLAAGGAVSPSTAYAATRALATEYPDADEEELEFAAMMAAAEDCTSDTAIVVAADAEASDDATPGVVVAVADVVLDRVASFHVGPRDADELGWYATQELNDLIDELG
ncbi:MAG: hypothetical protein L0K86_03410 [Actinomycetia bacterium]|nr:hypothetical protein [Actinomycetes bacterium]